MTKRLPLLKGIKPIKDDPEYQRLWTLIDGSIRKAIYAHPECFNFGPELTHCRESMLKRIVGDVMSLPKGKDT